MGHAAPSPCQVAQLLSSCDQERVRSLEAKLASLEESSALKDKQLATWNEELLATQHQLIDRYAEPIDPLSPVSVSESNKAMGHTASTPTPWRPTCQLPHLS